MGKLIDLTGQKFGYLTVLERDFSKKGKVYWLCQCDCGNTISVRGDSLKKGYTKTCGCSKINDLTGQKFGRLMVLRQDFSKKDRTIYWICKCDCGNIVSVKGSSLKSHNTKSCGCLQKEIVSKQKLVDLTGQKFGYLTVLKRDNSKINREIYWICQCDCGNIISVRGSHLKTGATISCGCYKASKGEDKISSVLSSLKISFVQQKTFNNLKYKSKLRFDFFLPDYNCCIEYQGEQHYKAIQYFGGEKQFEEQKDKDNIKRQWCKENNIKLIEIPYWNFNKINEDYLKQLILK